MTQIVQLARRALPLLALALAAGACDRPDPTEPLASADAIADVLATPEAVTFASTSFRGGIPFGVFHLPKDQYGKTYNGSLGNIYPAYLIDYLETARRNGTKVILSLPSSEDNFKNSNLSFNMTKWKKMVDRFKGVNFSSYVKDGTVVGHYILDEPYDPQNWGGRTISSATVDELAKYSKQLWPDLPTIVRARPYHLKGYRFKYLDAAWSQYSERFGSAAAFISADVKEAKALGLQLVVGMNHLAGGSSKNGLRGYYSGKYAMGAGELESWGNTLLANSYPCAFISWKYDSKYLGRSDIKSTMTKLAQKARSHATKSCRKGGSASNDDDDDDGGSGNGGGSGSSGGSDREEEEERPSENSSAGGAFKLTVSGEAQSKVHLLTLRWSGASGRMVNVYRNGSLLKVTENDNRYTNARHFTGRATASTYVYKVCEQGGSRCSNQVTIRVQ